ncbi:MAG: ATP-dependent sacrificial sulfur transferase LarE [Thermoplasmata archaeon]
MSSLVPIPAPIHRVEEVVAQIRRGGRAMIALSGGVDSSLVAALAFSALGPDALAVTLTGPAVSRGEVARAERVASVIGLEHVLLEVDPLANAEYRENRPDRCYFCRSVETSRLREFGASRSFLQYLDGVQRDDLTEVRPGLRAMDEAGFTHPLLWAGWRKSDVRAEARRRGLPNWEQPSDACLASRIAHGEPVTRELLDRVESAEAVLLALGFRRVRVRVRRGAARIEVDPSEVARLRAEPLVSTVTREVEGLGFTAVTIDPRGYPGASLELPTVP